MFCKVLKGRSQGACCVSFVFFTCDLYNAQVRDTVSVEAVSHSDVPGSEATDLGTSKVNGRLELRSWSSGPAMADGGASGLSPMSCCHPMVA